MLRALDRHPELNEHIPTLNRMKASVGCSNDLERALYLRGFLAKLGDEPLYGGIFLDAMSQRPIRYPVIRAALNAEGKGVFYVMPIHVPFFTRDPVGGDGEARDDLVAPEAAGDWQQFPESLKGQLAGWGESDQARSFRRLIRSPAVRAALGAFEHSRITHTGEIGETNRS